MDTKYRLQAREKPLQRENLERLSSLLIESNQMINPRPKNQSQDLLQAPGRPPKISFLKQFKVFKLNKESTLLQSVSNHRFGPLLRFEIGTCNFSP